MKCVRPKLLFVLASAIAIGLVLVWAAAHRSAGYGNDWIRVSKPTIVSRTNAGAARGTVAFRVSNVGPREVHFQVWWFECRAKTDRTLLATNRLKFVNIPLPPGTSTNLTMELSPAATAVEDALCCCQVRWMESWYESAWRRGARIVYRPIVSLLELSDRIWPPWPPQRYATGTAFAANVQVADYFHRMYGFTRTQWLEDLARMQSARTQAIGPRRYGFALGTREPTADEAAKNSAREAFIWFCQTSTNSTRDTDLTASPKAAPPHQ